MEHLKSIPTSLPEGIAPTFEALLPHLQVNSSLIHSQYSSLETHSYGSHPRQELDVYYPQNYTSSTPVLLFLFGGGFFMGEKRDPRYPDLIYANFGGFFASKGFIFVVANYRLSKGPGNEDGDAKYPSGGEDCALAINWIQKNLGAKRDLFLLGNSAGAVHVMTFLFEPQILKSVGDANLKGVILLSPPCHQRRAPENRKLVNAAYYGSEEDIENNSPIRLLRSGISKVPMLSLVGEYDEAGIIGSWTDYKAEYEKMGGRIDEIWMKGHNHISPILGLNCDQAEGIQWGEDAVEWMKSKMYARH
jgi:Carboxylesterase family